MKKTILLLEDDVLDVKRIKHTIDKLNVDHVMHVAHNGIDALAILNGNSSDGDGIRVLPDIILLDLNMPKMNGLEFLGIIKNYYNLKNIKTYVMTTSVDEYDIAVTQNIGVSGYVLKPLDFDRKQEDIFSKSAASLKEELCGSDTKILFPVFAAGAGSSYGANKPALFQKIFTSGGYLINPKLLVLGFAVSSGLGFAVYQQSNLQIKKTSLPAPFEKTIPLGEKIISPDKFAPVVEEPPVRKPVSRKIPLVKKTDVDTITTVVTPPPVLPRHGIKIIKVNKNTPNQNTQVPDSTASK